MLLRRKIGGRLLGALKSQVKWEKIHADLFQRGSEALRSKTIPDTDYYVCRVCGNTVEGMAPEKCPVCGAPKTSFFKVE
ncbi:MAG: rubredoxin-like domain-containing protein [Nitrososphaeria archaeon]